jgi:hypothetical protein
MTAISDIDICFSDIGRKYAGFKNVIPKLTSEFIPISDIKTHTYIYTCGIKPTPLDFADHSVTVLIYEEWDVGNRIQVISSFRYPI